MRGEWIGAKRLVVKIGSSLLVDATSGALKADWFSALADDIAGLRAEGREIIVVSSGAIALGRNALKLPKGALKLEDSQAAASVGQIDLAHAYEEAFRARSLVAAQVLLTLGDTEERRRYLNARNTMTTLLRLGAVPAFLFKPRAFFLSSSLGTASALERATISGLSSSPAPYASTSPRTMA